MVILTEKMKQYILSENKRGFNKEAQRTYDSRIIQYAKDGLKDLTLLAEKLSEKQQDRIFTEETLRPLLRTLFTVRSRPDMSDEALDIKRKRILRLSYDLIQTLGGTRNSWAIAPEVMGVLTKSGSNEYFSSIQGIKAILIKRLKAD